MRDGLRMDPSAPPGGAHANCCLRGAYRDGHSDGNCLEAATEPVIELEYCCDRPPDGPAWDGGDRDDNHPTISSGVLDEWNGGVDSDSDGRPRAWHSETCSRPTSSWK